ncbi:MAG: hypothetical protein N3A71_00185 [Candidatus Dojkabacteria bacterium]|nr:hypothetical protein [Candidatus Dojkabacteria bacterium]
MVSSFIKKILSQFKKLEDFNIVYENATRKFVFDSQKNNLIIIIGPSSAGKSTLAEYLIKQGFYKVRTFTTRPNTRKDNINDDYIRPDTDKIDINDSNVINQLIREYGLLEYNIHAGSLYGTPKNELMNAIKNHQNSILVCENNGARSIYNALRNECNLLVIFIIPDSLNQIKRRMKMAGKNNITSRLLTAKREILDARNIAHFVIHFSESVKVPNNDTLGYSIQNTYQFIKYILKLN